MPLVFLPSPSVARERLFVFGRCLDPDLQTQLFTRVAPLVSTRLRGHALRDGEVAGDMLARHSGHDLEGGAFTLAPDHWKVMDDHYGSAYACRRVLLEDGTPAWAYLDANPLRAAERLAIIGDGIAYGRCDPEGGWATRLAVAHISRGEDRRRCFNLAFPGATVDQTADHIGADLGIRLVDTVIVHTGVNDLLSNSESEGPPDRPAAVLSRIAALCEAIERTGARVLLMTPQWADVRRTRREFGAIAQPGAIAELRGRLLQWAGVTGRDIVDTWGALAGHSDLLADGIHPSPAGHRALYDCLARTYPIRHPAPQQLTEPGLSSDVKSR